MARVYGSRDRDNDAERGALIDACTERAPRADIGEDSDELASRSVRLRAKLGSAS